MKVLIDIPQEMFKATQTYYSDFTTRLSMKKCTEIIANGTPIPEGATNGDMIKAMFPNAKTWEVTRDDIHCAFIDFKDICEIKSFPLSWWNAPYKGSED